MQNDRARQQHCGRPARNNKLSFQALSRASEKQARNNVARPNALQNCQSADANSCRRENGMPAWRQASSKTPVSFCAMPLESTACIVSYVLILAGSTCSRKGRLQSKPAGFHVRPSTLCSSSNSPFRSSSCCVVSKSTLAQISASPLMSKSLSSTSEKWIRYAESTFSDNTDHAR